MCHIHAHTSMCWDGMASGVAGVKDFLMISCISEAEARVKSGGEAVRRTTRVNITNANRTRKISFINHVYSLVSEENER